MPMDVDKAGDLTGRKMPIPPESKPMKDSTIEELVKAIDKLTDEKKRLVAEFIRSLMAPASSTTVATDRQLSPAEITALEEQIEHLCEMAKNVGPFDILELMDEIRR